ncbi:MAG: methylmalonyl Co-A mutase-associated GTPase MeaB [Cytophagales bacterium]|nr:MAG: methylmalonyl Co-A mutase-associated GTPase MeaB [Cytophagales bacterium]TAF61145.1 MAG: methylmalonyl Co-A mutase-associated GTPase MeaB [Cytophagales bacterium]
MRQRLPASAYIEGILSGNRYMLSRAITLVESKLSPDNELADQIIEALMPHTGQSLRIGITGVPGVGKSTFIESFGYKILNLGYRLAVLAIDPSSQTSKGSILGDKTRMELLSQDERAYIRPSPAGSSLGGVAARTREAMLLCEAAGYNVIFIETVGVGQSETVVRQMTDFFLLLMLAGAGDDLQGIKRGIIEMADLLLINKADGDNLRNAQKAQNQYKQALHLFPPPSSGFFPQVLLASALEKKGLDEVWDTIEQFKSMVLGNGFFAYNRAEQAVHWLNEQLTFLLKKHFFEREDFDIHFQKAEEAVRNQQKSPQRAATELIQKLL